jgi:hypothetical protein
VAIAIETLPAVAIARSRACRGPCEDYLARIDSVDGNDRGFSDTLRCVAMLSLVADRLETDDDLPIDLIDSAVELARDLYDDRFGCAAACQAAADSLSELLDGRYERA